MAQPVVVVDAFTDQPVRRQPGRGVRAAPSAAPEPWMQVGGRRDEPVRDRVRRRPGPTATTTCAGSRRPPRSICAATPRWPAPTCWAATARFHTRSGPLRCRARRRRHDRHGLPRGPGRARRRRRRLAGRARAGARPGGRAVRQRGRAGCSPSWRRRPTSGPSSPTCPRSWHWAATSPWRPRPATATGVDSVCRVFAPAAGIPEDPVTGSAHCLIAPWLAARTGRRQVHRRAGLPAGRGRRHAARRRPGRARRAGRSR